MSILIAAFKNDTNNIILESFDTSIRDEGLALSFAQNKAKEFNYNFMDAVLVRSLTDTVNLSNLHPKAGLTDPSSKFLSELKRAIDRFHNSYVGLHYFITSWRGRNFNCPPKVRHTILDKLVDDGKVEIYESEDGHKAIRLAEQPEEACCC